MKPRNYISPVPLKLLLSFIFLFAVEAVIFSAPKTSTKTIDGVEITVTLDGRLQKTRAVSIIKADPETIWKIISDFDRHEEFMPNVAESKIISQDGNELIVYKQMKVALQKITFTMDVKLNNTERSYSWTQHEGPFKVNRGSWVLTPRGDNTLVEYTAFLEPNFYLPGWIKKILINKSVPKLFKAVEREAHMFADKQNSAQKSGS